MQQLREVIGGTRTFDGNVLCLPYKLAKGVKKKESCKEKYLSLSFSQFPKFFSSSLQVTVATVSLPHIPDANIQVAIKYQVLERKRFLSLSFLSHLNIVFHISSSLCRLSTDWG